MKRKLRLEKDLVVIILSIVAAYALVHLGVINNFLTATQEFRILGSFIAGVFFTSAFTIAPASVALAGLALGGPLFVVAFWGALGALCGDLILFFFIRDMFADDLMKSLRGFANRHFFSSFHLGFLKWFSPLIGGLIIASPLPDELGLTLMGLSKTRLAVLIPVSFVFNYIGILLLALIARAI
ncbi:MAG: hypothetical protein AAB511_01655 [Patescibacteria group bacterium]